MSLSSIFNPNNIAVIGATDKENSVGAGLMKNLESFSGEVFAINPNQEKVFQKETYDNINAIKDDVNLAIIAVPAKIVPEIVKECANKKVDGIIIISAGFAEAGKAGRELQEEVLKTTQKHNISLLGPNSLGFIDPPIKLNASFAPAMPSAGSIAFISQSGALIDSVVDWANSQNYGFSNLISLGNSADIDFSDLLEYLKNDSNTKAIALYLEGIKDGKKFMQTAQEIIQTKPIVALKGGKTKSGNQAIASHTAALTSGYNIYSAAFKQSGIHIANELEDLFDKAKALAWQPRFQNGIGIIANSGGCGVLAVDKSIELRINLPKLKPDIQQKFKNSKIMHPSLSIKNPLDLIGDALPERYEEALNIMLSQENINGLIIMQTLQIMTDPIGNAQAIIQAKKKFPEKPIICSFIGGEMTQPGIDLLEQNHIPNYPTPERAARAISSLIHNS